MPTLTRCTPKAGIKVIDELVQLRKERDYWRNMAEAYADEVRSFTRKTLFVEYERERQQRINGTDND